MIITCNYELPEDTQDVEGWKAYRGIIQVIGTSKEELQEIAWRTRLQLGLGIFDEEGA